MKLLPVLLATVTLHLFASLASAAPKREPAEPAEKTHVVAPGQTLAKIAKRYRVSPQDLREANDLSPGTPLKPGTRLVIPSEDVPADRSAKKRKGDKADKDDKDDKDDKAERKGSKSSKGDKADKDERKGKAGSGREDRDTEEDEPKGRRKGKKDKDKDKDDDKPSTVEAGHVRLVHGDQSWEGKVLVGKGSKVTNESGKAFARLLAPEGGKSHAIDAKLIALVARVSDHFGGRPIEVVSGYRPKTSKQHTPHSKHNTGSAIDFHIPGVRNEEVRDYVRSLDKVGVGYYPNSGFIHLDVRPTSFSWTDTSRAGESPKYTHDEPKEGDSDKKKKNSDDRS